MKNGQRLWTRSELILVMNLYCKHPFGKMHSRDPNVIHLANLLGRTTGAVAYKLVNFASMDPALKARGIKGASNASNLDKEIWNEFFNNWDLLPIESEKLLAESENTTIELLNEIINVGLFDKGLTRDQVVKIRVNQILFRKMILASYNNTCCITGLNQTELLVAGHIKPWSSDEKNRLNPQNGILLNALHDKAFECGLITITTNFEIRVSSNLLHSPKSEILNDQFLKYHEKKIIMPSKFLPDIKFLKYHNETRFKG